MTIRLRRGPKAQWIDLNPVLLSGEPAYETDTRLSKVGDGETPYVDLPYQAAPGSPTIGYPTTNGVFGLHQVNDPVTMLELYLTPGMTVAGPDPAWEWGIESIPGPVLYRDDPTLVTGFRCLRSGLYMLSHQASFYVNSLPLNEGGMIYSSVSWSGYNPVTDEIHNWSGYGEGNYDENTATASIQDPVEQVGELQPVQAGTFFYPILGTYPEDTTETIQFIQASFAAAPVLYTDTPDFVPLVDPTDEVPLTEIIANTDIPQVAAQPTLMGKALALGPQTEDGLITLGYGDYGVNTGPIDVLGLDPVTGDVVTLFEDMATEQIAKIRRGLEEGVIWVPDNDTRGLGEATLVTNVTGSWTAKTVSVAGNGPLVHMFDVAQLSNGDVYVCGVRKIRVDEGNTENLDYGMAVVYKSVDDGDTWTESLKYPGSGTDPYNRFYYIGKSGDNLVVSSDNSMFYWVFHEGTWTQFEGSLGPGGNIALPVPRGDDWFAVTDTNYGTRKATVNEDGVVVPADVAPSANSILDIRGDHVLYLRALNSSTSALVSSVYGNLGTFGLTGGGAPHHTWSGLIGDGGEIFVCNKAKVFSVDLDEI